jgi:uncharacterized protein YacL
MSSKTPLKVSHDYALLTPKRDQAFPIPCNEWDVVRTQIEHLAMEPWLFHTLGSLLIGAALATVISIWTGAISTATVSNAIVIAWAVVAACLLIGLACLYFAHKERKVHRSNASNVVTQMRLIEQRFEREAAD